MIAPILRLGAGVALGAAIGVACTIPNPDHCANQDSRGNVWCARHYAARPFCSPCRASNNGCVEYEPFACGDYRRDAEESSTGSDAGTSSAGPPSSSGGTDSGGPTGSETGDTGSST